MTMPYDGDPTWRPCRCGCNNDEIAGGSWGWEASPSRPLHGAQHYRKEVRVMQGPAGDMTPSRYTTDRCACGKDWPCPDADTAPVPSGTSTRTRAQYLADKKAAIELACPDIEVVYYGRGNTSNPVDPATDPYCLRPGHACGDDDAGPCNGLPRPPGGVASGPATDPVRAPSSTAKCTLCGWSVSGADINNLTGLLSLHLVSEHATEKERRGHIKRLWRRLSGD